MNYLLPAIVAALAANAYSADPDSCYPSVGCFSNDSPWTSETRAAPPPQHPSQVSTTVTFYSVETPSGSDFSIFPEISMKGISLNTSRPTFVLIHGFGGNAVGQWIMSVKDSMIRRTGGNVLALSWGPQQASYEQSVSNARVAGKLLGMTLEAMRVDPARVHMIARCIGTHIAAYAAKYINENGVMTGRITALNPARVMFQGLPAEVRLDTDDADFVEVFHTTMAQPSGHLDIYFNGVAAQPGCPAKETQVHNACSNVIIERFYMETMEADCMTGQLADIVENGSWDIEQVKPRAEKGSDKLVIGLTTPYTARGNYLVYTNQESPFCKP